MSADSRATRLRTNLDGTRAELQAFVASLKGRSAAEAMGSMARSRLLQAMVISLVVQSVAMLAMTIPYALRSPGEAPVSAEVPAVSSPDRADAPASPTLGAPPAPARPNRVEPAPSAPAAVDDRPQPRRPGPSMDDLDIDRLLN